MVKSVNIWAGIMVMMLLTGCVATIAPVDVPPPPAAQVEVVGIAPYAGAIWVPGAWGWHARHHRYVWHGGYWRR